MAEMFLGRQYDPKTHTWTFKDGNMAVPDEMRQEVLDAIEERNILGGNGAHVFGVLFGWKDRLTPNPKVTGHPSKA